MNEAFAVFEVLLFITAIVLLWWISREKPMKHIEFKETRGIPFTYEKKREHWFGRLGRWIKGTERRRRCKKNNDFPRPSLTAGQDRTNRG